MTTVINPEGNTKGNKNEQQWKPHKDPLSFLLLQINWNCRLEENPQKPNSLIGSNVQTKQKDCVRHVSRAGHPASTLVKLG